MHIIEISSEKRFQVEITLAEGTDCKSLKKERYFFDWSEERNYEVYKLQIVGSNNILGLISLERIPVEWRVHIRLLTVSKENKGQQKKYGRIAGNLIAHAAKIAVQDYGELACVSLMPKSQIAHHYISEYKMLPTGMTLSLEGPEILNLINRYSHE
ncbi:MAG: hypothetical protein LAT67_02670 [Balneolales bacterium]|nr:hypothetical protein [Balneolales bacterium]